MSLSDKDLILSVRLVCDASLTGVFECRRANLICAQSFVFYNAMQGTARPEQAAGCARPDKCLIYAHL